MARVLRGPASPQLAQTPEGKLEVARNRREAVSLARRLAIGFSIAALTLGLVAGVLWSSASSLLVGLVLATVSGVVALYNSTDEIDVEIRDLEFAIEIGDTKDARANRAYKLFKDHQFELRRYYDLARQNNRLMLAIGVACLALGTAIVGLAGWWVLQLTPTTPQEESERWTQIIVGVLGAIGGILINYVAAVYLKMYAAAAQAFNDFHNRLVTTHHLHLGNYIAARIEDTDKRESTLQKMAEELAKL